MNFDGMQIDKEGKLNCPACKSKGNVYIELNWNDLLIRYLRCTLCKCVYAEKIVEEKSLITLYGNFGGYGSEEIPPIVITSLRETVQSLECYRTELNSICDIGYGAGTFLKVAQEANWNCSGNEFSLDSLRIGKKNGWDVIQGNLVEGALPGPFDVVTIIETLEHVQDPQSMLFQAKSRLRSGGALYGTTPNAGSLNMRIFKENWDVVIFPNHPVLFTKKSLKVLLNRLGFTNIKVSSRGINPYQFLKYLRVDYKPSQENVDPGTDRVNLGYKLNENFSRNLFMRRIKSLIQFFLRVTNLGDTLVFSAEIPLN